MLKILIIGNSHSTDAFKLLSEVFNDQMPGQDVVMASLYYSGCSIAQHNKHIQEDAAVYRYTENTNGEEKVVYNVTVLHGLQAQDWDIIMLQAAKSDRDETLNLAGRRKLEKYVDDNAKKPYVFAWHHSWPSPNDEAIFSPTWVRQPPAGYKENLMKLYGFDPVNQFTIQTRQTVAHIIPDDTYTHKVSTATAIMHAHLVQKIPQLELWRDYTHLHDFGRLIVAYAMYAQLTGNKITSIGIDTVPVEKRHDQFKALGDLKITDEMKKVIISAANYSLEKPWAIPVE